MDYRVLGRTGAIASRIGLGCVTFGREIGEAAAFQILDEADAQGINLLDTAAVYGNGESERIVGRWLTARHCRGRFVVMTKAKPPYTAHRLRESLQRSLERLQVEQVDFFLFHQWDAATPLEEGLAAMNDALEAGLIRAAGCSNFDAAQMTAAAEISSRRGLARLEVNQPAYSLVTRGIEARLLPYCRRNGIGVVSYSPLAAGFLSGKYGTKRRAIPRGSRFGVAPGHADLYFTAENFTTLDRLSELAAETGVPMTRLAFAWALRNRSVDTVLAGATRAEQVRSAVDALRAENLEEHLRRMDRWSEERKAG